jgi:hypothetical protein
MHVDHAEAPVGIFTGDGDRVRVSNQANMLGSWTIQPGKRQRATKIIRRQLSVGGRNL